jgi:transcriptional regulator with XRE-family HTH domain
MDYKSCKVIPNLLRKYRRIRGLSQKQVARILGLKSASRVSRWEKGSCIPSYVNVIRLSIVYRTMADALFRDLSRTLREEIYRREEQILEPESPDK